LEQIPNIIRFNEEKIIEFEKLKIKNNFEKTNYIVYDNNIKLE
jgi:hypothetical protein